VRNSQQESLELSPFLTFDVVNFVRVSVSFSRFDRNTSDRNGGGQDFHTDTLLLGVLSMQMIGNQHIWPLISLFPFLDLRELERVRTWPDSRDIFNLTPILIRREEDR
jgi:hypothetical protein